MRLRITVLLIVASTTVMVVGCEAPKEITPVAPPGFEYSRTPAPKEGEGAQAVGEQGAKAAVVKRDRQRTGGPNSPPTPIGQPTKTASGLIYETLQEGTGATAKAGDTVKMHYTGTLENGKVFDSSRKANKPFEVEDIGFGRVIKGWNEGVPGMKVGERRKLTIPPALAYGEQGAGSDIPPNATLIFDVELLDAR